MMMMMMMMHDPVRAMYRRDHCITVHKLIKRVSTIMYVCVGVGDQCVGCATHAAD